MGDGLEHGWNTWPGKGERFHYHARAMASIFPIDTLVALRSDLRVAMLASIRRQVLRASLPDARTDAVLHVHLQVLAPAGEMFPMRV